MGKGGHGPGMAGGSHSHDPEFADDEWNLYQHVNEEETTALNATNPRHGVGVLKPYVRRLDAEPFLASDADEELMVVIRFTSPVHVRKLMVVGGGGPEEEDVEGRHPNRLRCYVNRDDIDFGNVGEMEPAQEFELPINSDGSAELITVISAFTNVTTLALYFPSNHGEEASTLIRYIGMQGEHTHHRREAVHADYELLCQHGEEKIGEESHSHVHEHGHGHGHGHSHDHHH